MFLREGLIARRPREFKGNTTETIWLELIISKKIWYIIFFYRPPINNNKYIFSSELSNSLNRAVMKYDNFLVIGDLNTDTLIKKER